MGDLSAAEGGSADTRRSAPDKTEDDLAESVLVALDNSTPAQAYEPVADYVVTRIEDILTAVSGQRNLSDELVEVVLQDGYIPLTEVRGHRTAGEWLVDELRWELENDQAVRVVEKFANLLEPRGNSNAESLNRWLTEEFFQRHVERTGGEPEVWHLSSEMGGLQVLVYGRRLNRERLTRMTTNLVRRVIDQHQRQLQQAQQQDDVEGVGRLEASLRDLHLFEVAIGMLQVGSSDEAKLKYPWRRNDQQPQGWVPIWTEGIRPNIAPLQRLGLLARPVLSDEELVAIQSAV